MKCKTVPLYALYGSEYQSAIPRYFYLETVDQFRQLHGLKIKPHRHIDLYHFIWLEQGHALVTLDSQRYQVDTPCLLIVPPTVVHAFTLSKLVRGYSLTLATSFVDEIMDQVDKKARWRFNCPVVARQCAVNGHEARISTIFKTLTNALACKNSYANVTMFSYSMVLMVEMVRLLELQPDAAQLRTSDRVYREFHILVESHFYSRWKLADYAKALSVSERTLQRACKAVTGHTPNNILQQRMLLQAKRELLYSQKTIAEIAETLGFSEASTFSHFFSRSVGIAPRDFRQVKNKIPPAVCYNR